MLVLPVENQIFIRSVYGLLSFLFFLIILPFHRPYFTTAKYLGCLKSTPLLDRLLNPLGAKLLLGVWMTAALMLCCGKYTVLAALINLIFSHIFFIRMRWTSPLRGMGAPGYIHHWLGAFVFFMEYARHYGDTGLLLHSLVLMAFRLDFALMMTDSGIHKIFHGYPKDMGMNYGLANPAWSYWPEFFKKFPQEHFVFRFFNHSAYIFQVAGGICLLFPPSHWLGALIISASFLLVKSTIRLGVLCDMVILATLIYTHPGGIIHGTLQKFIAAPSLTLPDSVFFVVLNGLLTGFFSFYIILLPFAKAGLYFNFYGRRALPQPIQKVLEIYTNSIGIILWRVFTIELIDYFMRIYFVDRKTGERTLLSRFGHWKWNDNNRFLWVGESIMSVIVFNTERYFPQTDLFRQRLLRYAASFQAPPESDILFEWVILISGRAGFDYVPAKEYCVNLEKQTIEVKILDENALKIQSTRNVAMHASVKPGSYAPPSPAPAEPSAGKIS